jgi:hypothetical protein
MLSQQWNEARWFILQGLVVVVVLLGHDLLMASVVSASPGAPGKTGPASLNRADETSGAPNHGPSPTHPSTCDTTGEAITVADLNRDTTVMGMPVDPLDGVARAAPASGAGRWMEPLWPPGTLRALLQVYRI